MVVDHGKRSGQLNLRWSTGQDQWLLQAIFLMCSYMLYLRHNGAILMTHDMSHILVMHDTCILVTHDM